MMGLLPASLLGACHIVVVTLASPDTPTEKNVLKLETATTATQRERGLMERERLPEKTGMVFAFDAPQTVYFWMKDTPLPLDMIFLDASGVVQGVEVHATPESETIITSPPDVQFVIELAGDTAINLGLKKGVLVDDWTCAE